ncbi:hypothetical protein [Streptomyces sp. NBC_01565]|uniref:hypothetical protein n=1 Tax=unclassified Streptomyces TaxID=2593676 RepID=UPI002256B189|nr:hypothetical protein [Streptomyces sp. NBC_01565]MCX4543516.1 hypothetical protein [Streptomyces sp. NBC_01565]
MIKFEAEIPIPGYGAGQYDFGAVLATRPQAAVDAVNLEVADRAANAEEFDGQACVITVVGHSDRDDTPGLTPEQRRESERNASRRRADDAAAWLFRQIVLRLQASGITPPATVADLRGTSIFTAAAGAADLVHPVPAGETERRENRRVVFLVAHLRP